VERTYGFFEFMAVSAIIPGAARDWGTDMNIAQKTIFTLLGLAAIAVIGSCAQPEPLEFAGAPCKAPPVLHCPDKNCAVDTVVNGGPVLEPETGRNYFLDYPCDLKKGEKVTLVLSLHGAGSYGNWQRHYFPILDYVDKYRLVVATPSSPTRFWTPKDDKYLQNIVTSIIDQVGKKNIKAFWLAGHSQGGMTSNRLVCTDFFKSKVDGWLSLSGGRIGPVALSPEFGLPEAGPDGGLLPALAEASKLAGSARPGAASTPNCDINFVFETGEKEIAALPDTSPWAEKYHCSKRVRKADIVDTKPGYVYDSSRQDPANPAWGRNPRPGTADVWEYPNCDGSKVIADIMRLDKGHTEGLEPKVTEALVKAIVSAPGGKIKNGS